MTLGESDEKLYHLTSSVIIDSSLLYSHVAATKISPMVSDIFVQHSKTLIERLQNVTDGESADLRSYFTNLTMDVIGDAGFGTDFGSQEDPDNAVSKSVKLWIDAGAKIGLLI